MTASGDETRLPDIGWPRRARRAATEHLGLKVTSLLIALLLWFVVHVVHGAGGPQ